MNILSLCACVLSIFYRHEMHWYRLPKAMLPCAMHTNHSAFQNLLVTCRYFTSLDFHLYHVVKTSYVQQETGRWKHCCLRSVPADD